METLFDYADAKAARDAGVSKISENNASWVERARTAAIDICQRRGEVTSDDLRKIVPSPAHPNAWGAVFRSAVFAWTGRYVQSQAVSRHAGMQRVWKLSTQH